MIYILAVSDENELHDNPVELPRVDILLSCGDLSPHYLGFLSDKYMPSARIMVHGNHDQQYFDINEQPVNLGYSEKYNGMFSIVQGICVLSREEYPFLDDDLSIGGFSGISAHGDPPFYYTDYSLFSFKTSLFLKKHFSSFSGVDILLTHAPPDFGLIKYDIGDHKPSPKIAGLKKYLDPKLWLYGHIHRRYTDTALDFLVDNGDPLNLINACPYRYFSFDQHNGRVKFLDIPQ